MNAQPSIIQVPLAQLRLSPRNARKTGGHDIEGIAASISAHNLLQNLIVTAGANDAEYEVVAGGRRLAALQLLRDRGQLDADYSVPCKLVADDDVAFEASTAENTLREAMHPADQFDAFRAMVDNGKSIEDVAAHFGVSDLVVRRRLKLANVNPQLVQLYRDGGASLEQLQALALTDNHEAQRQASFSAKHDWERQPRELRDRINRSAVQGSSQLAKFVGIDAYEAAGGGVRRDLFSDREDCWLLDSALLDRLALDKLEAEAEALRNDGWAWAEAHLKLDYAAIAEYGKHPQHAKAAGPTPEQEVRLDEIDTRIAQIEAQNEADEGEGDDPASDALWQEHEALQEEAQRIEADCSHAFSTEVRAESGVLVHLGYQGVEHVYACLKPGQKIDKSTGAVGAAPEPTAPKVKPPAISAAVLLNLSAHRSEVARHHVRHDPQLALALLVDWLASTIKHDHSHMSVLRLSAMSARDPREGIAKDVHKALRASPAAEFLQQFPRKDRLAWLIKRPQAELLQMLAYGVANSFDGLSEDPKGHAAVATLHAAIGFDMADHWNPSCDGYLGRISRPFVIQAVSDAKGKDVAAPLAALKKDALVADAGKLLAGTGWLPPQLRGPSYGVSKASASKSKAKKSPAKKKPAKKAAARKPAKASPKAKRTSPKTSTQPAAVQGAG